MQMRSLIALAVLLSGFPGARAWASTSPYPDAGVIEVSTTAPLTVSAKYSRQDPLRPIAHSTSTDLTRRTTLPLAFRSSERLITLHSLTFSCTHSLTTRTLERPELDEVRQRARSGVEIRVTCQTGSERPSLVLAFSPQDWWELPARLDAPGLSLAESDILDVIRLDDVADSLIRLRAVSSASNAFHSELQALLEKIPAIDAAHLKLLIDAIYFPPTLVPVMRARLSELSSQPSAADQAKVLAANLALADRFQPVAFELMERGLAKMSALKIAEAFRLLDSLPADARRNEAIFRTVFEKLGGSPDAFKPSEKLELIELSLKKLAIDLAGELAADWFRRDSDRKMGTLLDLLRKFPEGSQRDRLSLLALDSTGNLSLAEVVALTLPIRDNTTLLSLLDSILSRVPELSAAQVLTLAAQRPAGEARDAILVTAGAKVSSYNLDGVRDLLLACSEWSSRTNVARETLSKVSSFQGSDFAAMLLLLPEQAGRDNLVAPALEVLKALRPLDFQELFRASLTSTAFDPLFGMGLSLLLPASVAESVVLAESIQRAAPAVDSYRDKLLIRLVETATDLSGDNFESLVKLGSTEGERQHLRSVAEARLQKP